MEINDNGVVKTMRVQAVNDGGVLRFHRKITENSGGVLREIFAAYPDPISGSYSFAGGTSPTPTEIGKVSLTFSVKATFRMSNILFPQGGEQKYAHILIDGSPVVQGSEGTTPVVETTLSPGEYKFSAIGFGVTGSSSSSTYYPATFDYEITFGGTT